MRAAEFLRALADTLDRAEQPAMTQSLAVQAQPVVVAMNPAGAPTDAVATQMSHIGTALDGDNFVPPLQQKIEIMKKMAGMPHIDMGAAGPIVDEDEPFEG